MARKKIKSIDSKTTYWQYLYQKSLSGEKAAEPSEANPDVLPAGEPLDDTYRALKLRAFEEARLTQRERWVITYVAAGHSHKEAADELGVSRPAVSDSLDAARKKILKTYTRLSLLLRLGVDDESDKHHS